MTNPSRAMEKVCENCGLTFRIPMCRERREKCCSSACKAATRSRLLIESRASRMRSCTFCGSGYVATNWQINNGTRFCSISCSSRSIAGTDAARERAKKIRDSRRKNVDNGITSPRSLPKGDESPNWKGGLSAAQERTKAKGSVKAYRAANPHKVREWMASRCGRKIGRLPKGTVNSLIELQKCKCAICNTSISGGYHVDHITPLARGGKHERLNIQLLCPTCNVRKSAKDPIRFAQERGMLL